jgi:hypothetical protein
MRTDLALVLLALSANAAAQDLGTLFFSAQEREAMDRRRQGEPAGQAATPRREPVITGYVKRSDGKSTVFIDKRAYPARGERVQSLLKPQVIERFEPAPLPPEPERFAGEESAAQAVPEAAPSAEAPKGDKAK